MPGLRLSANDNTRQLTLTARLGAGLERGGRHGLKPMLRPPSTSSVTMPRHPLLIGYQPRERLSDGQACAASRLCVGKRWPGRNDAEDKM